MPVGMEKLAGTGRLKNPFPPVASVLERLNYNYEIIRDIILSRQSPCSGLIPASTAVTSHGDYRDAWVRDNVYSILAVFGLYLAYNRFDDDTGRAYELEHSVVKCMRGLLFAMMRQSKKVEAFKYSQAPLDALHAKYNTTNCEPVVADHAWGHLQVDATSIFLLALAQMTTAGLRIIFTQDEVDFVQNLVFYIERSYRTPDFGVWERGNKMNHGLPELNSSSIGMAAAALQAINRVNLFGSRGGPLSEIHVLPDEIARNCTTLLSRLPRESQSKEIDAALLSVISYPAFAITNEEVLNATRLEIISKLEGEYGCKRFLRDGHQTVLEDTSRLHYEPNELTIFEHIECEWPLFFTYLILDGLFRNDQEQVDHYRRKLEKILVTENKTAAFALEEGEPPAGKPRKLVPELYIVPRDKVAAEKRDPHSQERIPNENIPLVWAQSLYLLGNLIEEGLLDVNEIDPLGLHKRSKLMSSTETLVQIVLLSETETLKFKLLNKGVETQTLDEVAPFMVTAPSALREAYTALGMNTKLGLSGRPKRPIGTLSTCKGYRLNGRTYFFTPHFMDMEEFYMTSDNNYLISLCRHELVFVRNNWNSLGRPTMCILLKEQMFSSSNRDKASLMEFITSGLRSGNVNGVRVRVGRLQEMSYTACIESLDFLTEKKSRAEITKMFTDPMVKNSEDKKLSKLLDLSNSNREGSSSSANQDTGIPLKLKTRMASYRIETVPKSPTVAMPFNQTSPTNNASNLDTNGPLNTSPEHYGFPTLMEKNILSSTNANIGGMSVGIIPSNAFNSAVFLLKDPNEGAARRSHSPQPSRKASSSVPMYNPSSSSNATNHPVRSYDNNGELITSTLSEEVEGSAAEKTASSAAMIQFRLGDPSNIQEAIEILRESTNLYEQLDLLHYLYTCHGLNYETGISRVKILLEEVYLKACYLSLWSIIRQSAALLRKVVNSLSVNLIDLLIQQKQVSIGLGASERFITQPISPERLTEIIYTSCTSADNLIEASLVQELLIFLGSFIRAEPKLYDGILRIRIHHIMLVLRDEVERQRNCADEVEAFQVLISLSPSDLKQLLGNILKVRVTGEYYSSAINSNFSNNNNNGGGVASAPGMRPTGNNNKESSLRDALLGGAAIPKVPLNETQNFAEGWFGKVTDTINVSVQSAGYLDGNFCTISVQRNAILPISLGTSSSSNAGAAAVNAAEAGVTARAPRKSTINSSSGTGPITLKKSDSLPSLFDEAATATSTTSNTSLVRITGERGITFVSISINDGSIIRQATFDVHLSEDESAELAKCIQYTSENDIIVMGVRDDASGKLTPKLLDLIQNNLKSNFIRKLGYRDSWCLISQGKKGNCWEDWKKSGEGPTRLLEKSIPLLYRRMVMENDLEDEEGRKFSRAPPVFGPSGGDWLHRRKINGALNRVPPKFYPRVWSVLDRCQGLCVGNRILPRDPTVSEKTPEEFNFALHVEYLLEAIADPAERHLVVECLTILSKINERNPELEIRSCTINIDLILKEAILMFWSWMTKNPKFNRVVERLLHAGVFDEGTTSNNTTSLPESTTSVNDKSSLLAVTSQEFIGKHWKFIANMFYDLPMQGIESTSSFITKSALQNMPYRIESTPECANS